MKVLVQVKVPSRILIAAIARIPYLAAASLPGRRKLHATPWRESFASENIVYLLKTKFDRAIIRESDTVPAAVGQKEAAPQRGRDMSGLARPRREGRIHEDGHGGLREQGGNSKIHHKMSYLRSAAMDIFSTVANRRGSI